MCFISALLSEMETVRDGICPPIHTRQGEYLVRCVLSHAGSKRLATRGLANSVAEMLRRLPSRVKALQLVHYHGGKQNAELRESLKDWFHHVSALLRESLRDPTSRYVVVIPLKDRQASTWLQPFLDRIVFTFGAPDVIHSDDAPEFLSEALALLAKAADIKTTTTLGHNARGNATIEVWWRFWNRCLRLLRWPDFASRIAFAYNSVPHEGIGSVTAFQIYHGTDPRNTLASSLADPPRIHRRRVARAPRPVRGGSRPVHPNVHENGQKSR